MSVNLTIVDSLDEPAWRGFVDQHPCGNIFHTPEMFQVFERVKGYRPALEAVVDEGQQVLALLLPVDITLMNGPLRRLTTRSIAYGSVLPAPGPAGEQALGLLLGGHSARNARRALFTELRNLADLSAVQPVLQEKGYAYEEHLNYLIDLRGSPDEVLANIGSRTRKHIRQGLRKGDVIVEQVKDRRGLEAWYGLVQKTYRNARVPLADRSLFEAAWDVLMPKGMVQFWLARLGSTFVAASAELLYKNVIYGWYSGVDRDYSAAAPGEMLMWSVLSWGAQNGYEIYDFGGAGKPDEPYGVRDFKAKFGGKLVCYGRNTKIHSPGLLRLSTMGYRILTAGSGWLRR